MSPTPPPDSSSAKVAGSLAAAVEDYRDTENLGVLIDRVRALTASAGVEAMIAAAAPFRDMHEVVIPVYERVVAARPNDAQSLVILANSYWLTGRGPEAVGELAARAIAADPANRGGWHLWALSEADPRARMLRWQQVAQRFPADQLARAALADNAVSVAGAEGDPDALALGIRTYEGLLAEAALPAQRAALEGTLQSLRTWRL